MGQIVTFVNGVRVVREMTAEELAAAQTVVTVDAVKAEATRRIELIAEPSRQRNLTARGTELTMKLLRQGGSLTAEEEAEVDAGQAIWDEIKAIRAASNVIEAMDPIPTDYTDDSYWP